MNVFDAITDDIPLESFRALVVAGLFLYIYVIGRRTGQSTFKGWHQLLGGFGLLLFASVLDVTDNFEQLNRYVIIGDTHGQAFLEKVVGYLGGFILLFIGFMRWLPMVVDGNKTLEHKALIETQQRYRDLVDLSPDAIILHRSGKIIYANAAAAELIGVQSPESIIGKSTMDFVHPDYQDQTRARLESLSDPNTKKLPLINIKAVTSGGEVRDVEVASGIINFEGEKVFQSVLRDISARVRAEEALKESEIDLRAILDSMAEFYYRADMDGSIVRASGAAHEVTGWSRDEIVGMKLAERYVDEGGREKFLAALHKEN
ncbi:MAG: PAS domain S-box protein, partial [Sphingomonadales bacterium]|nr:PAS domain S-box protein [Sphingomonadales bacterium]